MTTDVPPLRADDELDPKVPAEARERAEQCLLANGGDLGLLGSNQAYQQVWARDSMICGLGLLLCQDPEGAAIFRRSLETLRHHQSPLGKLPHNVGLAHLYDPALIAHGGNLGKASESGVLMDTAHAGCVDGNLWYIIAHYCYYSLYRDEAYLREVWPSLEQALLWLRYQDSNECGLLEVHEAKDWADLLANRYNVLYDNVLYYAAWRAMAKMATALSFEAQKFAEQASEVKRKINTLLWIGADAPKNWDAISYERKEWLYPLKRIEAELVERPFYLPYVAFRDYADRFDTFGNLLAILFGVASPTQSGKILAYIRGCGLDKPYPLRALYPPIQPGDKDWREYYRVRNLNLPNHYHNGGAWPFIGGFYVAALIKTNQFEAARVQLSRLAHMNRQGRATSWEFNEWFHGLSGEPLGYAGQSWSAALYLYAHRAVRDERVPVFHTWDSA